MKRSTGSSVAAFLLPVCVLVSNLKEQVFGLEPSTSSCVPRSNYPVRPLRCGGTLDDQNGTIFYKPYEYVVDNERCVWSMSPKNYSSVTINILYLGHPLNISRNESSPRLDFAGTNFVSNRIQEHTANGTGIFNIKDVSSVFIIFSSGSGNEGKYFTGFILVYQFKDEMKAASPIQTPPVQFKYSGGRELSETLFIIPPANNFYPDPVFSIFFLEYSPRAYNSHMDIYYFNRSNDAQLWVKAEDIQNSNNAVIISGHEDILMIAFWSQYEETRDIIIAHVTCRVATDPPIRNIDECASIPQTHI